MIRKGDTITFEHVQSVSCLDFNNHKTLIGVNFDGQTDWWVVMSTIPSAVKELTEYYKADWAGTGRNLPYAVYKQGMDQGVISCM